MVRSGKRWLWGIVVLIGIGLVLLVSHDKPTPVQTVAPPPAPALVRVSSLDATYNRGTVALHFDVELSAAAADAVTVTYQLKLIQTTKSGTPTRDEAGSILFSPGETRKSVQANFAVDGNVTLTLALVAVHGHARLQDNLLQLTPTDISPKPVVQKKRPAVSYTVSIAVNPDGQGKVSGGGVFVQGRRVTVHAVAEPGNEFVHWAEGTTVLSEASDYRFTVKRNRQLTAYFRRLPEVTADDVQGAEGDDNSSSLTFAVQLSAPAEADVNLRYVTEDGTATGAEECGAGTDYLSSSGSVAIARGTTSANIVVPLCGDSTVEDDETMVVKLFDVSQNAIQKTINVIGHILNDDTAPVIEDVPAAEPAPLESAAIPAVRGQGYARLDADGNLVEDTGTEYSTAPWSCVLDKATGLVWEVKTDDGGLHHKDWTYSWYNSDDSRNGGFAGVPGKGHCGESLAEGCDTEHLLKAVNDTGFCGAHDWRLPTVDELQSLADLQRMNPVVNIGILPNTPASWYWSVSPVASDSKYAWIVGFYYGYDVWGEKGNSFHVYLVRGGE